MVGSFGGMEWETIDSWSLLVAPLEWEARETQSRHSQSDNLVAHKCGVSENPSPKAKICML